jgi:hypothetical protein
MQAPAPVSATPIQAHVWFSEWKTSTGVVTLPMRGASQSHASSSAQPMRTRVG